MGYLIQKFDSFITDNNKEEIEDIVVCKAFCLNVAQGHMKEVPVRLEHTCKDLLV